MPTTFGQIDNEINSQGVLTNEQALNIAKSLGLKTLNHPIQSYYQNPNEEMRRRLNKLKLSSFVDYSIVSASNNLFKVSNSFMSNDFKVIQTSDGKITTTYFACALVEATSIIEVRQHQTKLNTQTAEIAYKVIDVSDFGKALGDIKIGQVYKYTIDYIPTSNGWKPDMDSRNDYLMTDYKSSTYGLTGLNNHKKAMSNKDFINSLPTTIIGKWERWTNKEKKRESFVFNEDKTFTNTRKGKTIEGVYKFKGISNSNAFGERQRVLLIPRDGKNKTIYLSVNGNSGMYISRGIDGFPFRKEGPTGNLSNNSNSDSKLELLNSKKTIYYTLLKGFWKQSNNKSTLDFKGNKTLTFKRKKHTFEDSTYELSIENETLYITIYDKNLNEILKDKIYILNAEMRLGSKIGGKIYYKL